MRALTDNLRAEWEKHIPPGWQVLLGVGDVPVEACELIPMLCPASDFDRSVLPPRTIAMPTDAARACLVLYPRCQAVVRELPLDGPSGFEVGTLLAREAVWFVLTRFARQNLAEALAEYGLALWQAVIACGIEEELRAHLQSELAARTQSSAPVAET